MERQSESEEGVGSLRVGEWSGRVEAGKQINGFIAHKVVLILAGHLGSKIIHFAVSIY